MIGHPFFGRTGILPVTKIGEEIRARNDGQDARPTARKVPELPLVIDIKRYSFEDGPGIRSVVFFKGCPLRCIFCHNPESQKPGPEMAFSKVRCVECGACEQACPLGAVDLEYPGLIHRERCHPCGKCAEVCPTDALRFIGARYSVESLTEVLLRDLEYYRHSGGGVTLSGGECTLFPEYLETVLKGLKAKGVHTIVETSGYFNYNTFRRKIYPYLDLIYYDIKLADGEAHKRYCGKSNEIILRNFNRLIAEPGAEVQPAFHWCLELPRHTGIFQQLPISCAQGE